MKFVAKRRIPHILYKPKRSSLPSNLLFFDTETKQEINPDVKSECRAKLWFGYTYATRYEDTKCTREQWNKFDTVEQFWKIVKARLDKCRPLYLFAHNLPFDLTITDFWRYSESNNFNISYAVLEDPPTMIKGDWNGCRFVFVDTLNFWRTSLAEIGESVGLDKLEMPSYGDSKARWDSYGKRDVEVIAKSVLNLFRFIKDNDLGNFAISNASLAMGAFRHRFMNTPIYIHDDMDTLEMERESYHGGLVNCFYIGSVKGKEIHHFDVNSLYPWCMLNPVPVKLVERKKDEGLKRMLDKLHKFAAVADVSIKTKTGTYPVFREGKLLEAKGIFQTVLCGPELQRAATAGDITKIHKVAYYEKAIIFKEYVEYFYQMRQQFSKKDNPVVNNFAKLMMNSLYGKFAQNGYEWQELSQDTLRKLYELEELPFPKCYEHPDSAPDVCFGQEPWLPVGYPRALRIRSLGGLTQVKVPIGEHFESFPLISSYITSYAREHLRSLINIAGSRQTYYCDTDSLFVTSIGRKRLERSNWTNQGKLGYLKYEGTSKYASFYSPKDYNFGGHIVCKGISAKAIQIADNEYLQTQFEGLKSVLKRTPEPYITIKWIVKKNSRLYTKGIVLKDGWTEPFTLNEPTD